MSKANIRKQLDAGLAVFLSEGKEITKVATVGARRKKKEPKVETVEIEVDFLPMALQKKHFGV